MSVVVVSDTRRSIWDVVDFAMMRLLCARADHDPRAGGTEQGVW